MVLNEELELTYPEGFHVMDEKEMSELHFLEEGAGLCLSDPQRHIILTVGWKNAGLAGMMLNAKDAAKKAESAVAGAMKPFGIRSYGLEEGTVGGKKSYSFRYEYTAKETGMTGVTHTVKSGNTFYYFNYYGRTELNGESLPVLEEILGSVIWK